MTISIAMTLYNGESFLIQQLESIRYQSLAPDQVVIIDDCSTDNSFDIVCAYIAKYQLTHWELFRNSQNYGYIENFQRAIAKCQGDLIFTADQDDIWHQDKLLIMSKLYKQNPQIKVLASSLLFMDEADQLMKRKYFPMNKKNVPLNSLLSVSLQTLIEKNFWPGCTMAFTSEIASAYLKQNDTCVPHDWAIALTGCLEDGFFWHNFPLVNYRIHTHNTSGLAYAKGTWAYIRETLHGWTAYLNDLKNRVYYVESASSEHSSNRLSYLQIVRKRLFLIQKHDRLQYFLNLHLFIKYFDPKAILLDFLCM